MQEKELVLQACKGDRKAFGRLVEMYQARLRAFAASYIDHSDDVFDIVQDVFLDAFCHLNRFDTEKEFLPWLRGICRNRIRNYFRSRKKQRSYRLSLIDAAIENKITEMHKETDDDKERLDALKKCLEGLKDRHQQIVKLRYHNGCAIKEMAGKLNKSVTSITTFLVRIRTTLMKCVEDHLEKA